MHPLPPAIGRLPLSIPLPVLGSFLPACTTGCVPALRCCVQRFPTCRERLLIARGRQKNPEHGPALPAFCLDLPVVVVDDLLHHAETQPRAIFLAIADERLKESV